MPVKYHQISLKDTFSDCKDMFMDDVPSFFQLLEQHFDISLFIPLSFYNAFYKHLGRKRGYPACPADPSLFLKYCGVTHKKGRADRIKWVCPKVHMVKGRYVCGCKNPRTPAVKGRTAYTYENLDFRMFLGIQRNSNEWNSLYKIRTIVERIIDHLKINMCAAGRKSRSHTTTKADVFLAGIASRFAVIVAHSMKCPQYIRSLKPLIA